LNINLVICLLDGIKMNTCKMIVKEIKKYIRTPPFGNFYWSRNSQANIFLEGNIIRS